MAVQEYGPLSQSFIDSTLSLNYIHTYKDKTVSILSKYPIVNSGMIDFKSNKANTCVWADIVVSTDTIRVYSYHLESNRHDGKMPKVIRQDSPEKKSMSIMVGIVKYYNGFSMKRFSQAQLITEHTSDCKYPIILCGDLNDTPQSYFV